MNQVPERLYRTMRTIRSFEERVVELVNANEIAGATHEYVGQEAVAAGVCQALRPEDVITSTHRGHGHVIAKGGDPRRMMAELMGRITGTNRGRGGSMHIADFSLGIYGANGIVGASAPFGAGAAWVFKQDATDNVAVVFFGDGGINQGVLLETMNLAAIWNLPLIFICENNGYAVTMSTQRATAGIITDRAAAYGMPAAQVDGMDAELVLTAASEAIDRARAGGGPTFLECMTYRFFGHQTAEKAMGWIYRTEEEIARWRERDPLELVGTRIDQAVRQRIDQEIEELIVEAVEFGRAGPRPNPDEVLQSVYAVGPLPRGGG